MTVTPDGPRPPYAEVAADLREQIRSGDLAPGSRLGSYRELAGHYGVAGGTVQAALRVLRSEGLITSVPGRGTFVGPVPAVPQMEPATSGIEARLRGEIDELRREVAELRDDVERLEVKAMPVQRRGRRQGSAGATLAGEVR